MNKKQKIILMITALFIFFFVFISIYSDKGLALSIQFVLVFGIPGWLLYLAFKDKHEK